MEAPNRLALQLDAEISAVITAMRQNAKWAVVPGKYNEEDQMEPEPHYEDFRSLRRKIFDWEDWSAVQPLEFLAPFLKLVREPEVSGPITGVALTALWRLLSSGVLGMQCKGAAEAVNAIVDNTTQCKFEATSPASDEVVLFNILQVLQAVVKCEAGVFLTDESICKAYQAAFMLGNLDADLRSNRNSREVSELLTHYSRQIMGEVTSVVFERLQELEPGSPAADEAAAAGGVLPHISSVVAAAAAEAAAAKAAAAAEAAAANAAVLAAEAEAAAAVAAAAEAAAAAAPAAAQRRLDGEGGSSGMSSGSGPDDEYAMFGLAMVHRAVLAGGPALQLHEALLGLLHRELFAAMTAAAQSASLGVVAGICQVLLAVWQVLGPCSMLQMEAVLQSVLLRLADGKDAASPEQQEAALEGLLDLTRCPGFMHAVFLSCDCRLERSNLFEDLAGLLCRTAFPGGSSGSRGLGPMHLISLEALLALLAALAERLNDPPPQLQPSSCLGKYVDVWGPVCRGETLPIEQIIGHSAATAGLAAALGAAAAEPAGGITSSSGTHYSSWAAAAAAGGGLQDQQQQQQQQQSIGMSVAAAAAAAEVAAFEKGLKQRVMLAVDHFNKDYKKGFQFLQANKLLPELRIQDAADSSDASAAAAGGSSSSDPPPKHITTSSAEHAVDEDTLAQCIGYFLRVCPGLKKTTIGELLGEPDRFYLKVLDAFTSTFNFSGLSFDVGLRTFLESFKLPGEAQKIDRIINTFGKAYFKNAPDIFANEDAAYILAYSVIMLNTDRHNSQVKKKMEEAEFCRNLRGVNAGQDFPKPFLSGIYHSICSSPLRMSDTVGPPAVTGPAATALWALMAERTSKPRGSALILPPAVRHCFDTMMFRLVWGQSVHAMGVVLEHAETDAVARAALDGLRTATRLAAHYDVEGVADSAVLLLAKFSGSLTPAIPKPRVAFGRDKKACAAVEMMFLIVTRYGDCIRSSWSNVLELVLRLDKLDILPPALEALLDSDVWGVPAAGACAAAGPAAAAAAAPAASAAANGSAAADGADTAAAAAAPPGGAVGRPLRTARQRRAAGAGSRRGGLGGGVGVGSGFLRSVTQLIALQEPEYEAKGSPTEKQYEATALDVLHSKCAIQDVFADSRFLKQEALQALVAAIISAPGTLPRPPPLAAGGAQQHAAAGPGSGDGAKQAQIDRSGSSAMVDWEAAELCLDLLLVVLLRNRDRLSLLWPPVFDHLCAIIRGKGVEGTLVAAAAVGLLRLCQRLLPCKPEAAEPLLRGLQLVPSLDPEVAWLNAEVIAAEMLALVQVASPHIKAQWAWASACNLIKMTSVRPEAFPVSLEALRWVVMHSLTPLNYVLALEASVWFIERAALEHTKLKERCLALLGRLAGWLEGWSASLAGAGLSAQQLATFATAKSEFWLYLVEMLAKLAEHPDLQVRSAATAMLQTAAVSAEALGVLPGSIERGLRERMLPPVELLNKKVGSKARDMPQAEVTVAELVRVVSKAMLLHLPVLVALPGFASLWLAVLGALAAAAATGSEALSEAAAAALQNLLIMLHEMGVLQPTWADSQQNLWQHTWHVAHKISSNLNPQMLSPAVNPARQQQQQPGPAGLASLPQVQQQQQYVGVVEAAAAAAVSDGGLVPAAAVPPQPAS
ncbi:hypothetical protein OEZ85_009722 [Tetradesmus obliquus]|uniref:SEC7 domain-containing protein n=1 Tax=Tetradesmus obliquus TaxID=3088 RepID=A0ABY8UA64_TETOB|nr:hypothetical protein OEZ85_009722 [Tetradesmus obliquus]